MSSNDKVLAGLKEAILTEDTGSSFYAVASKNTTDAKGKEVFLMLAAEEALHRKWLEEMYATIAAGRHPEPFIPTASGAIFDDANPIFSDELKSRIGEAHWEMTALSVGLQLEQATIARYRDLAAAAGIAELQQFYERLVRWEEGHAQALERQSKLLREAYWSAGGFAPF